MSNGLEIVVRISRFVEVGKVVVISEDSRRFTVLSQSVLPDDKILGAVGSWLRKADDKRELQELREDCEAGMSLDNARQALKDLELLAIGDRLKSALIVR